ncbi:MAG: fimbrillin family protein [Prevotella sp.]|nr:fimbrillin family protein [Prevotella sp.]
MKRHIIYIIGMALMGLTACSNGDSDDMPKSAKETPMTFSVSHPAQTRATAAAFEEGDKIGLYVADASMPLEIGGNLVNNEQLTLTAGKWTAHRTLYWDEGTYNAYAYYPYMAIESIEDQPVSVATDQSIVATSGKMSAYEASDLLYARTAGVTASTSPVPLTFRHIMSKLTIRLVKGEDFEGDMPADAQVFIHNTVTTATVDISAGVVTRSAKGARRPSGHVRKATSLSGRLSCRSVLTTGCRLLR